jgi:hypothetical protein
MNNLKRQRCCFLKSANYQYESGQLKHRALVQHCARAGFAIGFYEAGMPSRPTLAAPTRENTLQITGADSATQPSSIQQKILSDTSKTITTSTLRVAPQDTTSSTASRDLKNSLVNRD